MTAKDLKNALLQEAVQGKLVPQISSEGNARDLLEEIKKEKAKLVKEGKLKKEKPLPEITEEDIPFDIPENWCWCRIGEIFNLQAGKTISSSEISEISNGNDYLCYGGNGIRGYVKNYNREGYYPLIGRQGALCGNVNFANGKFYATEHAVVVDTYANTNVDWAGLFLKALNLNQYATATAQPGLAVRNINEVAIPLPTLAEQKRIVTTIEKFMPLIEEYGKKETELKAVNEQIGTLTKKAILQEAVQGKLVPQIAAEGNAKNLLEEIKKEKSKLIKDGKIKKEKPLPEITEDEIPFDIPENWCWCLLKDISDVFYGFPLDASKFNNDNNGKMIVRIRDIKPAISNTFTTEEIPEEYQLHKNDMLIGMDGNFNVNFWPIEGALLNQRVCKITTKQNFYEQKFLFYILPMFLDEISENVSFCTVKHLSDKHLSTMYIPLPPLAEQKRIVAAIEKLLPLCEKLGE